MLCCGPSTMCDFATSRVRSLNISPSLIYKIKRSIFDQLKKSKSSIYIKHFGSQKLKNQIYQRICYSHQEHFYSKRYYKAHKLNAKFKIFNQGNKRFNENSNEYDF